MSDPTPIRRESQSPAAAPSPLPRPIVRKARGRYLLAWLIPLCALIAGVFYARDYLTLHGPLVVLLFKDVEGIKVGQTPVQYRGVAVGEVSSLGLSPDHLDARVEVRLSRGQEAFATEGTVFWIVRPEASEAGLTGLNTVFTGPYIKAIPGKGAHKAEFRGEEESPFPAENGLRVILNAPRQEHIAARSPVQYRGTEVGTVESVTLARTGDHVEVHAVIWRRYETLVHAHSHFWILSGLDVHAGILSGVDLRLESLRTLIFGGVAFATPNEPDMGPRVKNNSQFALEEKEDDDWKKWAPKFTLPPATPTSKHEEGSQEGSEEQQHAQSLLGRS